MTSAPEEQIAQYLRGKGVQHAIITDMLNRFAHDLAEAIRQWCVEQCPGGGFCTCSNAASLIDPEVPSAE